MDFESVDGTHELELNYDYEDELPMSLIFEEFVVDCWYFMTTKSLRWIINILRRKHPPNDMLERIVEN